MNFDLKHLFTPLIAVAILAVVGLQTSDALRHSGAWHRPRRNATAPPNPYARLEAQITALPPDLALTRLRDPFIYGRAPAETPRLPARPYVPPPPPKPVLTAILIGDDDPRVLIHLGERDYAVKLGGEFADYKVISIAADQVVLDRGGQRVILKRPTKGE